MKYHFDVHFVSRILPNGLSNKINPNGISYYQKLINELVKNNIKPVVTIYHWDLPQHFQYKGGWTNPLLVEHFVNYARIVIKYLDNVAYWVTINEPKQICKFGYGNGLFAPGIEDSGVSDYRCAYTVLKAHAATYRMYKKEFPYYKGKICVKSLLKQLHVSSVSLLLKLVPKPILVSIKGNQRSDMLNYFHIKIILLSKS